MLLPGRDSATDSCCLGRPDATDLDSSSDPLASRSDLSSDSSGEARWRFSLSGRKKSRVARCIPRIAIGPVWRRSERASAAEALSCFPLSVGPVLADALGSTSHVTQPPSSSSSRSAREARGEPRICGGSCAQSSVQPRNSRFRGSLPGTAGHDERGEARDSTRRASRTYPQVYQTPPLNTRKGLRRRSPPGMPLNDETSAPLERARTLHSSGSCVEQSVKAVPRSWSECS